MFEQNDELMLKVAEELRKPVRMDPAIDARVMQQIGTDAPDGSSVRRFWNWLLEPRLVAVSPLRTVALAAGIVALMVVARSSVRSPGSVHSPSSVRNPQLSAQSAPDTTVIQFVFVAPKASSVALVGDFNGWDLTRTPLELTDGSGMWSVTLPLPPGRHRYAFVVDGKRWAVDPAAPRAVEDDFGSPNSVVTVGEHST